MQRVAVRQYRQNTSDSAHQRSVSVVNDDFTTALLTIKCLSPRRAALAFNRTMYQVWRRCARFSSILAATPRYLDNQDIQGIFDSVTHLANCAFRPFEELPSRRIIERYDWDKWHSPKTLHLLSNICSTHLLWDRQNIYSQSR